MVERFNLGKNTSETCPSPWSHGRRRDKGLPSLSPEPSGYQDQEIRMLLHGRKTTKKEQEQQHITRTACESSLKTVALLHTAVTPHCWCLYFLSTATVPQISPFAPHPTHKAGEGNRNLIIKVLKVYQGVEIQADFSYWKSQGVVTGWSSYSFGVGGEIFGIEEIFLLEEWKGKLSVEK